MKDISSLKPLIPIETDLGEKLNKENYWKEFLLTKETPIEKEQFLPNLFQELESVLPVFFYDLLKKSLFLDFFSSQEIVFIVKNENIILEIQNKYQALIKKIIENIFQKKILIRFKLASKKNLPESIDSSKTFNNFIVGDSNSMAQALSLCVAQNPGVSYPALYIYGNSGLGKTHLLFAIANYINLYHEDKKIFFTSANQFMHNMVQSIKKGELYTFRKNYIEDVDVLFIDDIQELKDKKSTQNEFFHIFNELQLRKKQLIFTSDKHPKEITGLEERIQSRLNSTLVTEISFPDLETRIAILEKKASEKNISISSEKILDIAKSVKSNVRELEGQLIKAGAYSSLQNLAPYKNIDKYSSDKTTLFLDKACEYLNIEKEHLLGKARNKSISKMRQLILSILYMDGNLTLEHLGVLFSNRDHTSVLYAIRSFKKELKTNQTQNYINDLKKILASL